MTTLAPLLNVLPLILFWHAIDRMEKYPSNCKSIVEMMKEEEKMARKARIKAAFGEVTR